jgi:nucleotide-binding universal stress UspA family protein
MMTLHRILCPIDFSEPSKRALRHALAIARWHDSEVTVLHVEDVLLHAATAESAGHMELAERQHADLRDFIADAGGSDRRVTAVMTTGDPVPRILAQATSDTADLIVMGTNGRTGLARAVLGSVTERVVRQSIAPVLTIPPAAELRGGDPVMPFDPIVCAVDFSPASRKAVDLAILMGQEADARMILLHALQLPVFDPAVMPVPLPPAARIEPADFRKDALARLQHGLAADTVFRCRPETAVVEGRPADVILDTAEKEGARLIVMGVQSRSTLDRLLFGSTTRRVMQAAACPVLSIRAGQAAEPWPALVHSHDDALTKVSSSA